MESVLGAFEGCWREHLEAVGERGEDGDDVEDGEDREDREDGEVEVKRENGGEPVSSPHQIRQQAASVYNYPQRGQEVRHEGDAAGIT